MSFQSETKWLFDVRLWILVLFLLRLENIDLAPLDMHAYRQSLTLGVARNFLEWDANIFQPRTILCDSRPGFEVMEFPVLNYAIFLMWKIFGEYNWCFRLLNLILASFGLWHFYKIARRVTNDRAALASTVLFGTSIAYIYARKAMPDVFSLSLVLIGVNMGWEYLERGKTWRLVAFTVATALGLLSKIPAAAALVFLVLPYFDRTFEWKRKIRLTIGGAIAFAAMSAWYFVWIPWAEVEYHHGWFFRLGLERAWYELFIKFWDYTKERFFPIALQSRWAYLFLVSGLLLMIKEKQYTLLLNWFLYSAVFLCFMLQVGQTFSGHEYYVIPYVPIMALITGYGLSAMISNKWLYIAVLALLAGDAIHKKKEDFFIPYPEQKFLKLEQITDSVVPRDAMVVVRGREPDPSMLYFAHRRGWSEGDRVRDPNWLNGEATVGLHYAIIDRTKLPDSIPYPMLFEDNEFRIFKIKKD